MTRISRILPIAFFLAAGCATIHAPTAEELRAVESPSPCNSAWVEALMPAAVEWFSGQEKAWLPNGRPLAPDEIVLARQLGVQYPERVRIVTAEYFPLPEDPLLREQTLAMGFNSPRAGGLSLGYAVLIKPKYANQRWLLAHELVHVAQRERMGTAAFLRRYLLEIHVLGYARAPLELEAFSRQTSATP